MKRRTNIQASFILEERNLLMATDQLPKPDQTMEKSIHWHDNLLHAVGVASLAGDRDSCLLTSTVVVQDMVV